MEEVLTDWNLEHLIEKFQDENIAIGMFQNSGENTETLKELISKVGDRLSFLKKLEEYQSQLRIVDNDNIEGGEETIIELKADTEGSTTTTTQDIIFDIYWNPDKDIDPLIDEIENLISAHSRKQIPICGNFNAKSELWHSNSQCNRGIAIEGPLISIGLHLLNLPNQPATFSTANGVANIDLTLADVHTASSPYVWKGQKDTPKSEETKPPAKKGDNTRRAFQQELKAYKIAIMVAREHSWSKFVREDLAPNPWGYTYTLAAAKIETTPMATAVEDPQGEDTTYMIDTLKAIADKLVPEDDIRTDREHRMEDRGGGPGGRRHSRSGPHYHRNRYSRGSHKY
ncbi:hypothetical protein JTB14_020158 [Gonioctena quinquepunctata]|nr:hypothetical protein JTB14_020158 [Gonioctena quinquepunctata]